MTKENNLFRGLQAGLSHTESTIVDKSKTAEAYGSGDMEVFATPAMIALMEQTCLKLTAEILPGTHTTVGTSVEVKHISATPLHDTVTCHAVLKKRNDKKLTFLVEAFDSKGKIGIGTHKRFIVEKDAFLKSLEK